MKQKKTKPPMKIKCNTPFCTIEIETGYNYVFKQEEILEMIKASSTLANSNSISLLDEIKEFFGSDIKTLLENLREMNGPDDNAIISGIAQEGIKFLINYINMRKDHKLPANEKTLLNAIIQFLQEREVLPYAHAIGGKDVFSEFEKSTIPE